MWFLESKNIQDTAGIIDLGGGGAGGHATPHTFFSAMDPNSKLHSALTALAVLKCYIL